MTINLAPQRYNIAYGETVPVSVSFIDILDSGVLLTGTPTITEVTTTDLTLTHKEVNTSAITINGVSNAIGQAVTFLIAPSVSATGEYTVLITCGTNSTYPATRKANIKLRVVTA